MGLFKTSFFKTLVRIMDHFLGALWRLILNEILFQAVVTK